MINAWWPLSHPKRQTPKQGEASPQGTAWPRHWGRQLPLGNERSICWAECSRFLANLALTRLPAVTQMFAGSACARVPPSEDSVSSFKMSRACPGSTWAFLPPIVNCSKSLWSTENSMVVPQNIQGELPYDPRFPLLGIYTQESKEGLWRDMWVCAPPRSQRHSQEPRGEWSPSVHPDKWLNTRRRIPTLDSYSALERKEVLMPAAAWADLKDMIQRKISPSQNQILCDSTYMRCFYWSIHRDSKQWWLSGAGGGEKGAWFHGRRLPVLPHEELERCLVIDAQQWHWLHFLPPRCTLRSDWNGKFMRCVFYHNFAPWIRFCRTKWYEYRYNSFKVLNLFIKLEFWIFTKRKAIGKGKPHFRLCVRDLSFTQFQLKKQALKWAVGWIYSSPGWSALSLGGWLAMAPGYGSGSGLLRGFVLEPAATWGMTLHGNGRSTRDQRQLCHTVVASTHVKPTNSPLAPSVQLTWLRPK